VARDIGPDFKPQYPTHTHTHTKKKPKQNKSNLMDWDCNSVVKHLLSKCEDLGLILSTTKTEMENKKQKTKKTRTT
jgi:hypothetical protein